MPEPAEPPTIRRSDWPLSVLAVVLTAVAFAPFALLKVDAHHDGVMLKPALDVLAGQVVFRDTFSQYGVGLHYMQAGLLWAFGPTLPVMRLTAVGIYALTGGVLVSAWRLLLPRGLVVLALLLWLVLSRILPPLVLPPGLVVGVCPSLPGSRAVEPAARPLRVEPDGQRVLERSRMRPRVLLPPATRGRNLGGGRCGVLLGGLGLRRAPAPSASARQLPDWSHPRLGAGGRLSPG